MKKLSDQAREDADKARDAAQRAEEAYRRTAALLGTETTVAHDVDPSDPDRPKFHTTPAVES